MICLGANAIDFNISREGWQRSDGHVNLKGTDGILENSSEYCS